MFDRMILSVYTNYDKIPYGLFFASICVILISSILTDVSWFFIFLFSLFLFYLLCDLWSNGWLRLGNRVYSFARQAYDPGCDPGPILALSLSDLPRWKKQKGPSSAEALSACCLRAAAALGYLGRWKEGLALLDEIDLSPLPYQQQLSYWINCSDTLFYLGRPTEMAEALEKAQQLLEENNFPYDERERLSFLLQANRMLLRMLTDGPDAEMEAFFEAYLERKASMPNRISTHMYLAQCALARDDRPAAREHLNYVIAHGNKLYLRTRAQELLDKLNAETPPSL